MNYAALQNRLRKIAAGDSLNARCSRFEEGQSRSRNAGEKSRTADAAKRCFFADRFAARSSG
jgi:hypothetical protein